MLKKKKIKQKENYIISQEIEGRAWSQKALE